MQSTVNKFIGRLAVALSLTQQRMSRTSCGKLIKSNKATKYYKQLNQLLIWLQAFQPDFAHISSKFLRFAKPSNKFPFGESIYDMREQLMTLIDIEPITIHNNSTIGSVPLMLWFHSCAQLTIVFNHIS